MRRSVCCRIARPPTTTFAPAASERSFDCAAQSLRSAQDDRGARACPPEDCGGISGCEENSFPILVRRSTRN
jgi:hypothetical protein